MPRTIKETKLMYPDEVLKYLRVNDINHKQYTSEKESIISKSDDSLVCLLYTSPSPRD